MANIPSRSSIPYLPLLLSEAGATQTSAAALCKLRADAKLTRPSDVTLQKIIYRWGLVQRDVAFSVIDIFNHHLARKNRRVIHDRAVVEFDSFIHGFGSYINTLESISRDPENDPISILATVSGYAAGVISALKKKRLVPRIVATEVLQALQSKFPCPTTLRVETAQLNDLVYAPVAADEGRSYIIERFAQERMDIFAQI